MSFPITRLLAWADPPLFFSLTSYSGLVMYSFGFQQAFKRGLRPEDQLFLEKVRALTRRLS